MYIDILIEFPNFLKVDKMFEDLLEYFVIDDNLEQIGINGGPYDSGFASRIGQLTGKLLNNYRQNPLFMKKTRKIVRKSQGRNVSEEILVNLMEYVKQFETLLDTDDLFYYFCYFAVICELVKSLEEYGTLYAGSYR